MQDLRQERITNRCQFGTWTVGQIVAAYSGKGNVRFVLPPFQRDFVWKLEQQRGFVESVRQGLPIGALLLFMPPTDPTIRYIVDGLQRCTTLTRYARNPFQFVDENDLDSATIDQLARQIYTGYAGGDPDKQQATVDQIRRALAAWFKARVSTSAVDGYDPYELWSHILAKRIGDSKALTEGVPSITRPILARILDDVRQRFTIDDAAIPIIEFTGAQEHLPRIFERLNNEGTKLNKFDVLAAQWNDAEVSFKQEGIAAEVKKRYAELQELGLEYAGDDVADIAAHSHNFYLYEFILGLGRVLKNAYPTLYGKPQKSTAVESVGFNLATLVAGLRIAELGQLKEYLSVAFASEPGSTEDTPDVSGFASLLFEASAFANRWLEPALGSGLFKNQRKRIPHTEFQIAAIVATVARTMIATSRPLAMAPVKDRAAALEALKRTVRRRYWFEILSQTWKGSGDSKAFNHVDKKLYHEDIPREAFLQRLSQWNDELRLSRPSQIGPIHRGLLALALVAEGAEGRAETGVTILPLYDQYEPRLDLGNIQLHKGNGDVFGRLGAPSYDSGESKDTVAARFEWLSSRIVEALYELE